MSDKTYTIPEMITNLRKNEEADRQELADSGIVLHERTLGWTVKAMLDFPASDEGYDEFDRILTEAGL